MALRKVRDMRNTDSVPRGAAGGLLWLGIKLKKLMPIDARPQVQVSTIMRTTKILHEFPVHAANGLRLWVHRQRVWTATMMRTPMTPRISAACLQIQRCAGLILTMSSFGIVKYMKDACDKSAPGFNRRRRTSLMTAPQVRTGAPTMAGTGRGVWFPVATVTRPAADW